MVETPGGREFSGTAEFVAAAEPYLLKREAQHCLLLGLLPSLQGVVAPFRFVAGHGDATALVALMTPPHRLIVSAAAPGADPAAALASLVAAAPPGLPGVIGPPRESALFAEAWAGRRGVRVEHDRHDLIYRCTTVMAPRAVPGRMIRAGAEHLDLLIAWRLAFSEEALPSEPMSSEAARAVVEAELTWQVGGLWLWEAGGEVVSMAGARGPTRNGIRIGPVFTPPDRRGRGYAGALTAELTAMLLAAGRSHVTLFTDSANPVSNRVYRGIGYRLVGEQDVYDFR